MELHIGQGIGDFKFGMREADVLSTAGEPPIIREEAEMPNRRYLYFNDLKLKISIFKDYGNIVGYIESTNSAITYNGHQIIDSKIGDFLVAADLRYEWVLCEYGNFNVYSLDDVWLTFNSEFGRIRWIEHGAPINDQDEYVFDIIEGKTQCNLFLKKKFKQPEITLKDC